MSSKRLYRVIVNGQTFTYGYKPGTNLISSVTAGAVATTFGYQPTDDWLSSIATTANGASAFSAAYTYNPLQQQATATTSQLNPDNTTTSNNLTYGYDTTNELTSVTGTETYNYSYEGAGNQTGTAGGTANAVNEFENFTYNPRGDLTDDGTYAYTWNAADQLTAVTAKDNSVKVTFQWDGKGRCIEKDVYTSNDGEDDDAVAWALSYARKFVYDGTQLVEELDGRDAPVTGYTWGPQGLLAVTDYTTAQSASNPNGTGPTTYLAELDGQGNVVGLVNASSGQVAASYTYSPYGALLSAVGPAEDVCNVLYKQGVCQREIGLNLFGARFEKWQGVWTRRDPAGISGGSNLFEYCGNDPINKSDATGLMPGVAQPPMGGGSLASAEPAWVDRSGEAPSRKYYQVLTDAQMSAQGFDRLEIATSEGPYAPTLAAQLKDQGLDLTKAVAKPLRLKNGMKVTYYSDGEKSVYAIDQGWFGQSGLHRFSNGILGSTQWVVYGVIYFNNLDAVQRYARTTLAVESAGAMAALVISSFAPSAVSGTSTSP